MPERSSLNILLCGLPRIYQQHILGSITSMHLRIRICGFWDTKCPETPDFLQSVPIVTGPFSDLLLDKNMDVILLGVPPQTQHGILRSTFSTFERSSDRGDRFPAVILLPPVSPLYNTTVLSDFRNLIGMAMPLRFLPSVNCLHTHLKSLNDNCALNAIRNPSNLPSHWSLGTVRSIHARLYATKPIQFEQYSWMCEGGSMGGGLLNIYGAGLIDTLFMITLGLRIVSVTCLTRTFDTELSADPKTIRRISAEDYAVIIMELESRSSSDLRVGGGPVAMLCLSAELPTTVGITTMKPYRSLDSIPTKTDHFELRIELTGSSGRFILPECGDRVCWTPVHPLRCSQSVSFTSATKCSDKVTNGGDQHLPTLKEVTGENEPGEVMRKTMTINQANGNAGLSGEETVLLSPKYQRAVQVGNRDSNHTPSTLTDEVKSLPMTFSPIGEAWTHWFAQLSTAVTANAPHQALNSLMASPDHWGYIQRVLMAIDKSARMRCWVDVGTGERL